MREFRISSAGMVIKLNRNNTHPDSEYTPCDIEDLKESSDVRVHGVLVGYLLTNMGIHLFLHNVGWGWNRFSPFFKMDDYWSAAKVDKL